MAPELVDRNTEQLRILSIFQYVAAGIGALVGSFPLFHVAIGLLFILMPDELRGSGEDAVPRAMGFFFVGFGLLALLAGWLIAAAHFLTARFLRQKRAYWFCVIASLITCIACTCSSGIVGVASLIILFRPGVRELFKRDGVAVESVSAPTPGVLPEAAPTAGREEPSSDPPEPGEPGEGGRGPLA
jgi:hypothetical protein